MRPGPEVQAVRAAHRLHPGSQCAGWRGGPAPTEPSSGHGSAGAARPDLLIVRVEGAQVGGHRPGGCSRRRRSARSVVQAKLVGAAAQDVGEVAVGFSEQVVMLERAHTAAAAARRSGVMPTGSESVSYELTDGVFIYFKLSALRIPITVCSVVCTDECTHGRQSCTATWPRWPPGPGH